ncbi:MAG: Sec-independent protein translocase subunit TatA [gamma proteobacterium symbiont of Lucinoma myriamae]|nr:Sec-independent protein translocase subunit TatA [gamma proteobacterium symbiont of Lucinoma myriamae]MCU7817821.1 Sec-independent protein translocase subunit TatA [gamma proteobacterium symbiont of Lucinoma myriamae]MCU7832185.1 Sec-independent protein translocase subunit TatA [gamma proteobacterium symbiont of Lucinoma myriamae]
MGFGVTELLIILAIVLVLFGAKKLRNIGGDLGGAIKNFKTAMKDEENASTTTDTENTEQKEQLDNKEAGTTIEGTVEHKTKDQV